MSINSIPDELRSFLTRHIESVEELEVLLLLYRERDRCWTKAEVDARIRSNEPSIQRRLLHLAEAGIVVAAGKPPVYRYQPQAAEVDSIVALLAGAYKHYPTSVIQHIYEGRIEPLRSFAKAFELKRKP